MSCRGVGIAGDRANPHARAPWGFPELFVISQTALPALLYLPGTQPFRLPIRISAFAISLVALAWWLVTSRHNIRPTRVAELDCRRGGAADPDDLSSQHAVVGCRPGASRGVLRGAWRRCSGRRCWSTRRSGSRRLLWLLLICSGINSAVGVLQAYDPARWLPAEFSRFLTENANMGLGPVSISGRMVSVSSGRRDCSTRRARWRARHVGGPARARVCHERHRRLETCALARFRGCGSGRHLPESSAHQPGDRFCDAGDLRSGDISPEAYCPREPVLAARRRNGGGSVRPGAHTRRIEPSRNG